MIAATGETQKVSQMTQAFDKFNIRGIELENAYNTAASALAELREDVKDFLFLAEKKQKQDVKGRLTDMSRKLALIKNEFLTSGRDAEVDEYCRKLKEAARTSKNPAKGENPAPEAETIQLLEQVQRMLEDFSGKAHPDFFRIGFYKMKNPEEDLSQRDIARLNEDTLTYLDEQFMKDFIELEMKGVQYSFNQSLEKKKKVLEQLAEARTFFEKGDFDKAKAQKLCRKLSEQVEASIDRLEIHKDSVVYTFGTSLRAAVDKYFQAKKSNPREEARFARQSKKREALVAKGKTVDWKVVPKMIYDMDELRDNILELIDQLSERYQTIMAEADQVDFRSRSIDIIDYLKAKASQVVYRISKSMAKEKAIKLMEEVGIPEPRNRFYQYPFEFSGGMRQRIVIAIALAANPDILICDEPTTALDVTIQAQILELINRLKKERNLSVIFITHDLGVVANMADDIAVMYAGKIVEYGTADDIFYDPRHPYTWALLSSMPDLDTNEKLDAIPGTPPNLIYPPEGDAFADRNKYAMQIDFEMQPPMFEISPTHKAATWLLHPDAPKVEVPRIITDRIARMKKAGGDDNGK